MTLDRMDGVRPLRDKFAVAKACAAAMFDAETKDLAERYGTNPQLFLSALVLSGGRSMWVRGGAPLHLDGAVAGGLGVSGGTRQQDSDLAAAGVWFMADRTS